MHFVHLTHSAPQLPHSSQSFHKEIVETTTRAAKQSTVADAKKDCKNVYHVRPSRGLVRARTEMLARMM